MATQKDQKNPTKKNSKKIRRIILLEVLILLILVGAYQIYLIQTKKPAGNSKADTQTEDTGKIKSQGNTGSKSNSNSNSNNGKLTREELAAQQEQEKLQKEEQERKDLIAQADRLTMSYDYDGAIKLIQSYKGPDGGYDVYPILTNAISGYEATKSTLVLYGGSYDSVTQFNHIFFHSLVADTSKAFDGDRNTTGYNMYMTTISEFKKIIQTMYDNGYVLVNLHDIAKKVTLSDGTTKFEA
ncbi:MAG TPA: hypothetical protein VN131_02915, partial [Mobilitalea sp.]|nr:hypothetical protein [Mobilitalea sp.]